MLSEPIPSGYEVGVLLKDLGQIGTVAEIAIAELIANAFDAGANCVDITLPAEVGQVLSVTDNGIGLTEEQFHSRWLIHRYSRTTHLGEFAEMPPERMGTKRRAFGKNGLGRHALLCFASHYEVTSKSFEDTPSIHFDICPDNGLAIFNARTLAEVQAKNRGTQVSCIAERNLPSVEQLFESLAFMFLYDPEFTIRINGVVVSSEKLPCVHSEIINIEGIPATVEFWDISAAKNKKTLRQGVAFWVGTRLVGQPGYELQNYRLIDGRNSVATKHIIVVKSDLHEEVLRDWSGFRKSPRIETLGAEVTACVNRVTRKLMSDRVYDAKSDVLRIHKGDLKKLQPLGQLEVSEFVDSLLHDLPALNLDILSAAVRAALNLEKSRSGAMLLEKLSRISPEDADALDLLLSNWRVRDALSVMEEIDRRVSVVKAIEKLTGDAKADELATMHPLVTHARWLFGPEYDSQFYASNITIQNAAKSVFRRKIDTKQVDNIRQRPDLIFVRDASISMTGSQTFTDDDMLPRISRILLIELKRGNARIVLKHMNQAQQYVQDLLSCGLLDGNPYIHAFVVGHKVDPRLKSIKVGDSPEQARIEPCSFGQLARCANKRLFSLGETLADRFHDVPGLELVRKILGENVQQIMFEETKQDLHAPRKTSKPRKKKSTK